MQLEELAQAVYNLESRVDENTDSVKDRIESVSRQLDYISKEQEEIKSLLERNNQLLGFIENGVNNLQE